MIETKLPKLLRLAQNKTFIPRVGEVSSNSLTRTVEVLCCTGITWHTDTAVANYYGAMTSLYILANPGYRVEAGKRQQIPHNQEAGTLFNLDISKRHRLINVNQTKLPWYAVSIHSENLTELEKIVLELEANA